MPTLLTIPRELRDKILAEVVSSGRAAPTEPDIENRREMQDIRFRGWFEGRNIMYEKHYSKIKGIPTLLVNHQLRCETRAAIRRSTSKRSYVLDLMLVNERWLCPTWLSVPKLTKRVDKVYAALRTVHNCPRARAFIESDTGPAPIVWTLYEVLERLLYVGPVGRRNTEGRKKRMVPRISIKTLDIDIITPDEFTPGLGEGLCNLIGRTELPDGFKNAHEYSSRLFGYLVHEVGLLTCMGGEVARYAKISYERIGKMRMLLDGEVKKEWNFAEELKNVEFNNSFANVDPADERPKIFENWKKKAYDLRLKYGLPVVVEDLTSGGTETEE